MIAAIVLSESINSESALLFAEQECFIKLIVVPAERGLIPNPSKWIGILGKAMTCLSYRWMCSGAMVAQ